MKLVAFKLLDVWLRNIHEDFADKQTGINVIRDSQWTKLEDF